MPEQPFDRELKRGTLEMILLKLISARQMYGYELVAAFNQHGGEFFQIKEGTLYPVLYRLEDAGFIEPRWETLERGVPRKYYRITEAGEKQLKTLTASWKEFTALIDRFLEIEEIP
jgi:PadR family transcriptional regulator PadR